MSEASTRLRKQRFIQDRMRAAARTAAARESQFSDQQLLTCASDQQIAELAELYTRASAISGLIDEVQVAIAFREANQDLESDEPSES